MQTQGVTEHSPDEIDPGAHRVLADASRVAVLETLRRAGRPMAIPEIAAEVGLHPNTVRSHLALLTEHGYVTGGPEERARPGRPRLLYTAATRPGGGDRSGYRLLAEALISYLGGHEDDRAGAAIAAGRGFGARAVRHDARPTSPRAAGTDPSAEAAAARGTGEIADIPGTARSTGNTGSTGPERRPLQAIDRETAIRRIVDLLAETGFEPREAADGSHLELHRCPFRELAVEDPEVVCGVHLGIMQGALAELGAPVQATRLLPFVQPELCVATLHPCDAPSPTTPCSSATTPRSAASPARTGSSG